MEFTKVGSILADYDFVKSAISNELRERAIIERGARNAAGNPGAFQQSTGVNLRKNDGLMNRLIPGEMDANVRSNIGLKQNSPLIAQSSPQAISQNKYLQNNVVDRAKQIRGAAIQNKPIPAAQQTLSQFVASKKPPVPASIGSGAGKTIGKAVGGLMSNPLARKGALGLGLVGAGALAHSVLSSPPPPQPMYKQSSLMVPALETAGLGILAKPSIDTLRDPNAEAKERSHAKYELGGLGVLAAHPAYELANHYMPQGMKDRIGQGVSNIGGRVMGGAAGLATRAQQFIGKIRPRF